MAPLFLLILLLKPLPSHAQFSSSPPDRYSSDVNASTSIIILVVFSASVSLFLCWYNILQGSHAATDAEAARRHETTMRGLDKVVIESFPVMFYSEVKELKLSRGSLECAVCLCEFEDADALRLLPNCSHAFHPDCINMWFDSHTTCPVCRANLTPEPNALATERESTGGDPVYVPIEVDGNEPGRRGAEMALHVWTEEDRERFTLRLPESAREELMDRRLERSVTMDPMGRGLRKGSRGGWSYKVGRKDWVVKSDRWALMGRTWSSKYPLRAGGGGAGRAESLTTDVGETSAAGRYPYQSF